MDDNDQNSRDTTLMITAVLLMAAVYFICRQFGRSDLAPSACVPIIGAGATIRIRTELADFLWFWGTIAVICLAHIPLILFIPFPHIVINRVTLLPIGLVDYFVFWVGLWIAEKYFVRPRSPRKDIE